MTQSHLNFVRHLVKKFLDFIKEAPKKNERRLLAIQDEISSILMLDLESVREDLEKVYAGRRGGKRPRDPVVMLRTIILMFFCSETSPYKWVSRLHQQPELAMLSGFERGDIPGHATIYDFFRRIFWGNLKNKKNLSFKDVTYSFRHFQRNLKEEKAKVAQQKKSERLKWNETETALAIRNIEKIEEQRLPSDFLNRLERLLFKIAIVPSAKFGLLGDLDKLIISGDGTNLETQANFRGKPTCKCHEVGIKKCDCDRLYSDPQATWGWNSHQERYFFGYHAHAIVANSDNHDLPLHVFVDNANAKDPVMGVKAIHRLKKLFEEFLPSAQIYAGAFDKGYDVKDFYSFSLKHGINPIIPIRKSTPTLKNNIHYDSTGWPLCPGGARYISLGIQKGKLVFHCPAKRTTHRNKKPVRLVRMEYCPLDALCDPNSKMGPFLRIPIGEDPRMTPPILRDSKEFRRIYDKRSGVERFFSFLKETGKLKYRPYRRKYLFQFATFGLSVVAHIKAWRKHFFGTKKARSFSELIGWIESFWDKRIRLNV